jgi:hypothetical protein
VKKCRSAIVQKRPFCGNRMTPYLHSTC